MIKDKSFTLIKLINLKFNEARRGRPYAHKIRETLVAVLFRFRTGLPLRTVSAICEIPYVTLWRWCKTIASILADKFDQSETDPPTLIVDTTSTRVRTSDVRYYTSYKKQRVVKAQVVCDETGHVHAVSRPYAGSVHDKVIWNDELQNICQTPQYWQTRLMRVGLANGRDCSDRSGKTRQNGSKTLSNPKPGP